MLLLTQSKSKTPIARSVHCKFNCITAFVELGGGVVDGDERHHDEVWIGFALFIFS